MVDEPSQRGVEPRNWKTEPIEKFGVVDEKGRSARHLPPTGRNVQVDESEDLRQRREAIDGRFTIKRA